MLNSREPADFTSDYSEDESPTDAQRLKQRAKMGLVFGVALVGIGLSSYGVLSTILFNGSTVASRGKAPPITLQDLASANLGNLSSNATVMTAYGLPVRRGRYLYCSQGPAEPPRWLMSVAARDDSDVIWGSYKMPANESSVTSVFVPNTTWTTGRNKLFEAAVKFQSSQGWAHEYIIFADVDAELVYSSLHIPVGDVYSSFHSDLSAMHPAVAAVYWDCTCAPTDPIWPCGLCNRCAPMPCTSLIDGAVNAFHATVAPMLVPYDSSYDYTSWYASQYIMQVVVQASLLDYSMQFNQFAMRKTRQVHKAYPKNWAGITTTAPGAAFNPLVQHVYDHVPLCMKSKIRNGGDHEGESTCHLCSLTNMLQDYLSISCLPDPSLWRVPR